MKILGVFLFLSQLCAVNSFSQRIIDSIEVCNLPIRSGVVYEYDWKSFHGCIGMGGTPGLSILTKCDSVFHFGEGKIVAINNYGIDSDAEYLIVIGNKKEFFSYANLKFVALKKGDVVKRGTFLGLADISDDEQRKQVDLIFFNNGKTLTFKKTVDFIRCSARCDASATVVIP